MEKVLNIDIDINSNSSIIISLFGNIILKSKK